MCSIREFCVHFSAVSICCVLKQVTLSALQQSTHVTNKYQVGATSLKFDSRFMTCPEKMALRNEHIYLAKTEQINA